MGANTTDSNSQVGMQGQPSPQPSEPQNVQQSSSTALPQSPEQIDSLVAKKVAEALQNPDILKGMKDRRFNQIQQSLDSVSPVLERVKQILSPEQIEQFNQIQRDDKLNTLFNAVFGENEAHTGSQNVGKQTGSAFDVEPMLKSLQFPENDPSLAALRIKFNGNPQGLLAAAAELRLSQVQSPNPSGATGLSPQGGVATTSLQAEYEQRRTQLAQIQRGDQLTRSLAVLKAEYRQKGLAQI